MALRAALLRGAAPEQPRLLVQRLEAPLIAQESAQLGHLGHHHGHDFQRVNLILGKLPRGFRLHDQHAQPLAHALDRHAEERGENLLPRLRHIAEALFRRRIRRIHRRGRARHAPHKALTQLHPRLVDRLFLEALSRAKLQRILIAEQIDRADLGPHAIGNQMCDAVQTVLPLAGQGETVAQTPQQFAAVTLTAFGHDTGRPPSGMLCSHRSRKPPRRKAPG